MGCTPSSSPYRRPPSDSENRSPSRTPDSWSTWAVPFSYFPGPPARSPFPSSAHSRRTPATTISGSLAAFSTDWRSRSCGPSPCTGRYRYAASTSFFAHVYDRLLTLREWQAKLFDQRNILSQSHHPPHFRMFKTSPTMHHTSVIRPSRSRPYSVRPRLCSTRVEPARGPGRAGASSPLIGWGPPRP
jgi:hypothetical protein